jgi:hypothetical protein
MSGAAPDAKGYRGMPSEPAPEAKRRVNLLYQHLQSVDRAGRNQGYLANPQEPMES